MLIYGLQQDYNAVMACIDGLPELQYRRIDCTHTESYDEFLHHLGAGQHEIVLVLTDGAEGMEGIIAAQTLRPEAKKIWISNDAGFAIQAHRMECAYFAVKPITEEIIAKGYRACRCP